MYAHIYWTSNKTLCVLLGIVFSFNHTFPPGRRPFSAPTTGQNLFHENSKSAGLTLPTLPLGRVEYNLPMTINHLHHKPT